MNHEVRTMLEGMYAQVQREFRNPEQSWDRFIEYIAAENAVGLAEQMPGFLGWLFENERLRKGLPETYDLRLHSSDYYDHLGEMYQKKLLANGLGERPELPVTLVMRAEGLAKKLIPESNRYFSIFAPAVGTGRLLMAAHQRAPNAYLFGADPDLRAIRIALTNFAVHDIDGFLLHADATVHETDLATGAGQYNWLQANKWESCMDQLRPRVRPPKPPSFSTAN